MEIYKRFVTMICGYIRFSTSAQDETQQKFALEEYASHHGFNIDVYEMDEGVSGGVSYRDRNLYKLVQKMKPGDTLITTEISRLGRSISDVNLLVTQELKPRKLRLIVVKMGLNLDCSNLKAVDEMIIFAFGFAAQCEKEMIVQRTQSAIDARKEALKKDGGFFSKSGRWCSHLGNAKGVDVSQASAVASRNRADEARAWRESNDGYLWIKRQVQKGRKQKDILREFNEFHEMGLAGFSTREGCAMNVCTLSRWINEIKRKN